MKHILVASDMSDRSDAALARAMIIARQLSADISLVHVVESELPAEVARVMLDCAGSQLKKQVAQLQDKAATVNVKIRVESGHDWSRIVEIAQETPFDMIVMGKHRGTTREMIRGSTLDRVIRAAGLPVLVAVNKSIKAYEHVLAAVDFSLPARQAAALAASFAKNAELRLVHVYHPPLAGVLGDELDEERRNQLEHMMAGEAPDRVEFPEIVIKQGDIIGTLHDEAKAWPADLLALGTHGRTGVGLALLGGIAEQFLASPPCDLLIVKAW